MPAVGRMHPGVFVRSEVVITDGPLRGFSELVGGRLPARERVLSVLDALEHRARIESSAQWIRQA
jgi:hypothetical protein